MFKKNAALPEQPGLLSGSEVMATVVLCCWPTKLLSVTFQFSISADFLFKDLCDNFESFCEVIGSVRADRVMWSGRHVHLL